MVVSGVDLGAYPKPMTNSIIIEFTTSPEEFILKAHISGTPITRVATAQDLVSKVQALYEEMRRATMGI